MSKSQRHPDTERGLKLIEGGMPMRSAAAAVGVATSTLYRARKKLGGRVLPKGRPSREA